MTVPWALLGKELLSQLFVSLVTLTVRRPEEVLSEMNTFCFVLFVFVAAFFKKKGDFSLPVVEFHSPRTDSIDWKKVLEEHTQGNHV